MRLQVRSLASLIGLRILHSCELWCRLQSSSDLALLWQWCRPTAAAPIQPLVQKLLYAAGAALKRPKKKNQKLMFLQFCNQDKKLMKKKEFPVNFKVSLFHTFLLLKNYNVRIFRMKCIFSGLCKNQALKNVEIMNLQF